MLSVAIQLPGIVLRNNEWVVQYMQSITQFTETVVIGLEQDKGIAHRCEVIKRLGIRAELGQDDISRYVDAVFCFANERNRNRHATYSASAISEN